MNHSKHTIRIMSIKEKLQKEGEALGLSFSSNREDWGTILTLRGPDCYMQVCLSEKGGTKTLTIRLPSGARKVWQSHKSDIVYVYDFFGTVKRQRRLYA
jgi:hypothetical protein